MNEMLSVGVELMLTGMGIVFAFLLMLIIAVNLMSWVIQRYFPVPQMAKPITPEFTHAYEKGIVAAISTAIIQYRKKHR